MSRQRRGRRGSSGSGKSKNGERSIPSSHKSSRRKRGSSNKSRNDRSSKKKQPTGFKSVAPSPLLALHKITTSSPVGTGFNPLAEGFKSDSGNKGGQPKFYRVHFFESFKAAKDAAESILESCNGCDQVNIVIKAEGNMEDPELLGIDAKVAVFAGEAWHLIHTRRQEEGWYDAAQ